MVIYVNYLLSPLLMASDFLSPFTTLLINVYYE